MRTELRTRDITKALWKAALEDPVVYLWGGGAFKGFAKTLVVKDELLRDDHLLRLERCCQVVSHTPARRFEDIRSDVQVLITSWGCPRIDRDALVALPGLKLIAHLAGSVKGLRL